MAASRKRFPGRMACLAAIPTAVWVIGVPACQSRPAAATSDQATRRESPYQIVQMVYDGAFTAGWHAREPSGADVYGPGPASISFAAGGDWTISKPQVTGSFGALAFRMKAPPRQAEFLEVRVDSTSSHVFPRVKLRPEHRRDVGDGWVEGLISMTELNPDQLRFDHIVFRAFREVHAGAVLFDKIGLTELGTAPEAGTVTTHVRSASMQIDCRAPGKRISPLIYGFSYYALNDGDPSQWEMGATGRRWGGNTSSRYNWELGNAWNTGKDWFWENVEVSPYTVFLKSNAEHGVTTAVTVPMLGWVAKDTSSFSFSTAKYPHPERTDTYRPTAGNGNAPDGRNLAPPDPTTTSVSAPPEFIARWVQAIRANDAKTGKRSVDVYILDNEPALWNSTHRDVHPEPLTYDELLDRTLRYGAAVRQADPDALIAGPAAWGWQEYFYSAKDSQFPTAFRPDRRAHGDVPLLAWYLRRLREEEERTKVHILDLVDVHFYPQGQNIYGNGAVDAETSARRVRSTRGLWDRSYVDESYIREPVKLLPRLHEWIDQNFPGRGIAIGEWNFGGESHMSGGLAVAEALGRFAQNDVTAAYYWTFPPARSPVTFAFRAYRNFDGQGGRFLDYILPTSAPDQTSFFASRDAEGNRLVGVILNFSPNNTILAELDTSTCARVTRPRAFVYQGNAADGFVPQRTATGDNGHVLATLPPYSITVLDLPLAERLTAGVVDGPAIR